LFNARSLSFVLAASLFLAACDRGPSPKALQGTYHDQTVAVAGVTQALTLELRPDGNALLTHDFHNGKVPSVESGLWEIDGPTVVLTFFERDVVNFNKTKIAGTVVFKIRESGKRLVSTGPEAWDFQRP
jgi:hypothetical protein